MIPIRAAPNVRKNPWPKPPYPAQVVNLRFLQYARLAASQSIWTLFQERKIGPVGCLVAAKILADTNVAGLAGAFASFPQSMDFEAAWADLLALAPPGSPGEEVLLSLGRSWRGLHQAARGGDEGLDNETTQAVMALFATVGDRDLAYARAGLGRLWAAGLDNMVQEALMGYR